MNTFAKSQLTGLLLSLTISLTVNSSAIAWQSTEKKNSEASNDSDKNNSGKTKRERRLVRIIGDTKLDARQWPILGKPDAKYMFVEMFDYTCPHCREMHDSLEETFKKYGKDLAVLALPVPLNSDCNSQVGQTSSQHAEACRIANLAIAVWRVKPSKFHEYHNWLFETSPLTAAAARNQAIKLVDKDRLDKVLETRVPQKFIASHVKLYTKAGGGSIPKLLFPNITLVGNVGTDSLANTIERELGNQ